MAAIEVAATPGTGGVFSAGVRADSAALADFVHEGEAYRRELQDLLDSLVERRRAMARIIDHSPPTSAISANGSFAELIAETTVSTGFVDAVARALATADGLDPKALVDVVDAAIRREGLSTGGVDRGLELDLRVVERLERGRFLRLGLEETHAVTLAALPATVRQAARWALSQNVPPEIVVAARADHLVAARRRVQPLADPVLRRLLDHRYGDELTTAILDGLEPPDDAARRLVTEAMADGRSAREADLPDVYFPPDYRPGSHSGSVLEIVRRVGRHAAGGTWEGRIYADFYNRGVLPDSFHDDGSLRVQWIGGDAAELSLIGGRLGEDPELAHAFFEEIGGAGTAALPTVAGLHLSAGGAERFIARAGRALAIASHAGFAFTGGAVLGRPLPPLSQGIAFAIWRSPAALFAEGDFEPGFLRDATITALEQGQRDPAHRTALAFIASRRRHTIDGTDPRALLLGRVAEDRGEAIDLVRALADADALVALVAPTVRIDRRGVARERLPVARVLATAGTDLDAAASLLRAGAEAPTESYGDPGTALGLDAILATHATAVHDPRVLDTVGLKAPALDVPPDVWRRVHSKLLWHGHGHLLRAAGDRLVGRAMAAQLSDDGAIHGETLEPLLAVVQRLEQEHDRALVDVARRHDEAAAMMTANIGLAVSVATSLATTGSSPFIGIPAGAVVSFLTSRLLEDPNTTAEELARQLRDARVDPADLRYLRIAATELIRHDGDDVHLIDDGGKLAGRRLRAVHDRIDVYEPGAAPHGPLWRSLDWSDHFSPALLFPENTRVGSVLNGELRNSLDLAIAAGYVGAQPDLTAPNTRVAELVDVQQRRAAYIGRVGDG